MRYFLDTNIVIDFLRADPEVVEHLRKLIDEDVCIPSIVAAELYRGVYLSHNKDEAGKVAGFIKAVDVIDFGHAAASIFGEKYALLKKSGNLTQDVDLMIASTAIEHNATLITRNGKDFKKISDLKVMIISL